MNLEDLIKLAGVTKSPYDTPVQEEQPTEIEEQPVMDETEGMRALIALVTPEQLNQLQGNAPVEEEGFANSGDEYAGEPEEYQGTLGSPADLSLRRYLGANGVPVNVDETKVYEDHKLEDLNEAWKAYKLEERPSDLGNILKSFRRDGSANMMPTIRDVNTKTTGPDGNPTAPVTGPGDRGFTPGVQEPETRLKNQRGYDPLGQDNIGLDNGQEPPASLQNKRGFDPMGDQAQPASLQNKRGFTPGEDELDIGIDQPGEPIPEPRPTPDPEPTPGGGPEEPPTPIPGEPIPEPREPGEPTPTPGGGPEEPPEPTPGEPVPEPRDPKAPPAPPTPGGGPEEPPAVPGGEPVPEPKEPSEPTPTPGGGPEKPGDVPGMEKPKGDVEAKPVKGDRAGAVTKQMKQDARDYADREGLPMDQLGTLVKGTVGGISTTLEVDPNSGVVTDMKTGDIIGGDDAEAARKAAGVKSESLQRLEYLSGINEAYTMMERPSDRSRRGTRPPDAIGPGIIQPKVGEPIPEPRPTPIPMPIPGGGPEEPPADPGFDPDPDFPDEPEMPGVLDDPTTKMPQVPMSTKIDPADLDGDAPDEPDQGKDFFGRDKAKLAQKDAMFKKYGLTPPRSESTVNEEPNEGNEFTGELAKAKAAGKKEFSVAGKTYKVEDVDALSILKKNAGI
jgi:hypothetical protein